jgi:predicted alpha/beta-fold hydrolase
MCNATLQTELKRRFLFNHLGVAQRRGVNLPAAMAARTFRAFDEQMLPAYGPYEDIDNYYDDMCAVKNVRNYDCAGCGIPYAVVHACDDPVLAVDAIPVAFAADNDNHVFLITPTVGSITFSRFCQSLLAYAITHSRLYSFSFLITRAATLGGDRA